MARKYRVSDRVWAAILTALCLMGVVASSSAQISVTEYSVPSGFGLEGITAGPDGNVWYTQREGSRIGRITASGAITEYQIPTYNSFPVDIAAGSDGALWFTEWLGQKIGRITPDGDITEFAIPTSNGYPESITAGPDGNLWFTESGLAVGDSVIGGNMVGRITPSGVITEFPIPTPASAPEWITSGPDGSLWFTEARGNNIGRITTGGVFTEFPVGTAGSDPFGITGGPDGNLWFTEHLGGKVGRITTAGVITEFQVPNPGGLTGIVPGPDGNLWFVEPESGQIATITVSGAITEFAIPTPNGVPFQITTGPGGNLWFTERIGKIGKLPIVTGSTPPVITISSPVASVYSLNQAVAASYSCFDPDDSCTATGTAPNGSNVDTSSVGTKTFTVTAVNSHGNAAIPVTVTYTVAYAMNPLYDQARAVKQGACYPIKIQLVDANGVNVSSANLTVHAASVWQVSPDAPGVLEDVGNANPDNDFRYDSTLGGYIFNLSTKPLGIGTWNLGFTAGNDPTTHTVQFQVK